MRKDIIIIDDDRDLCTLLQESLLQENICADISCNGFDGIKSVKDKEYQLVVLDVMMPGISGFEVLERIRDMSNVPILMLTAKDDSTSKVKGLRAGADDYLTKPFEMEEFFARVLSLIRRYTRLNNMASKAILKYGDLRIDLESGIVELSGEELKLSAKEYGKKGKVELQSMKEEWEEKYKKTFRERKVKDILSALLFAMVYGVLLVGALSPAQNIINDIASGIGMGMATVVVAFVGLVEVKNRLTKRRNKREDADQEKSDTE